MYKFDVEHMHHVPIEIPLALANTTKNKDIKNIPLCYS